MSLRVSGEFWDPIKQTLVTDGFWQLPRYVIVILEAFLPKTRWWVDLFSFSWSCFWIWKPNTEQKVCFVFVAIVDRCIIVELIVGSSRARQHTSSCMWNRARLFINNPPHTRPRPDGWRQRWTLKDLRILGAMTGRVWVAHDDVGEIIKRSGTSTWVFVVRF